MTTARTPPTSRPGSRSNRSMGEADMITRILVLATMIAVSACDDSIKN